MSNLDNAVRALRSGAPVLVYDGDGREQETDIVFASEHIDAAAVRLLRRDAGGLVCTTIPAAAHARLGLPYLSDIIQASAAVNPALAGLLPDDIQYDASKPAFGLTINHRSTFTGITDADRATTIRAFAGLLLDLPDMDDGAARARLGQEFRAPGHVTLLNASPGGMAARQGHTELATALTAAAGLSGSATICEMLDARSGRALSRKDARAYAEAHGLVFVTGQEILDAWRPIPETATA